MAKDDALLSTIGLRAVTQYQHISVVFFIPGEVIKDTNARQMTLYKGEIALRI